MAGCGVMVEASSSSVFLQQASVDLQQSPLRPKSACQIIIPFRETAALDRIFEQPRKVVTPSIDIYLCVAGIYLSASLELT